ncbi:MAG: hypothetical protein AB1634_11235 [Thermodesulfobacteriota bacterium]
MGPAAALGGPSFAITADLGSLRGSDLFHSFTAFNLAAGESATFSGPATVATIIGRVTGGGIVLAGSTLGAPAGRIELASVASAGEVPPAAGDLSVVTLRKGCGAISTCRLARFSSTGKEAPGPASSRKRPAALAVTAGSAGILLQDFGVISGDSHGEGRARDIRIETNDLRVLRSFITADTGGAGDAGSITIAAAGTVTIDAQGTYGLKTASATADADSSGRSGEVTIAQWHAAGPQWRIHPKHQSEQRRAWRRRIWSPTRGL